MQAVSSALSASSSPLYGLHVVFVDDSEDERDLFAVRFATECAELVTVASADDALALVERGETDLVVTDFTLRKCDGSDLLRRMRALAPEIGGAVPAIAATGWATAGDRDDMLAAGFSEYVAKPYSRESLRAAVANVAPLLEHLRLVRQRCRECSAEQRALRARLVDRRAALVEDRERRALKNARPSHDERALGNREKA